MISINEQIKFYQLLDDNAYRYIATNDNGDIYAFQKKPIRSKTAAGQFYWNEDEVDSFYINDKYDFGHSKKEEITLIHDIIIQLFAESLKGEKWRK